MVPTSALALVLFPATMAISTVDSISERVVPFSLLFRST